MVRAANEKGAPGIARVHVESWRTTYRGIVPEDFLLSLSYEDREARWARSLSQPQSAQVIYVLEEDGIVGFASGGPEREGDALYTSELYTVYLLEAYQGQGRGRALVQAVARALQEAGHERLLVWVLADNPARRFYEALGGKLLKEKAIELGGARSLEVAYGMNPDALTAG
ncbi:MAG: GNAT family N-acetyltransferase [Deinococcota bacterium]|nr:GNAT family N-acetyltransferase [Deinococcota bacterium]MDQ3458793.1 GNAT family N-acetyltransferase [Deinococcota bacterium]